MPVANDTNLSNVFNEIHYRTLSSLVKNMDMENQNYEILGIPAKLMICPSRNTDGTLNGKPVEHYRPEGSWVVYLWDDIAEETKRPLVFDESVKIFYEERGFANIAEDISILWESRYCKDYLCKPELNVFLKFRIDNHHLMHG